MKPGNVELRRRLAQIAEAERAAAAADAASHLAKPPGERLLATIRHSDATLRAFPPSDTALEADREAWQRVRARLRRRAG